MTVQLLSADKETASEEAGVDLTGWFPQRRSAR